MKNKNMEIYREVLKVGKITMTLLEETLKKYNLGNDFDNFIFGHKLSKLTGFADMQIFGIGKNKLVLLPVTVLGSLEDKEPEVLKVFDEIEGFELKKGFLNHVFIITYSDGKKIKYKINRYIIPYPWHNESVKRLLNENE
jgi:hypothetical protein